MTETEAPINYLTYQEIEAQVDKSRVAVAEHEYTHITAIWGVGKKTAGATVIPAGDYLGATFPAGGMSAFDMQVAAMASAEHEGNSSDQVTAWLLERESKMTMDQAKAKAKNIVGKYRKDVLHIASVYLAYYGKAGDGDLRRFIRLAEDIVREKETFKGAPIQKYDDFYEEKRKEAELKSNGEKHSDKTKIEYLHEGKIARFNHKDGPVEYLCYTCNTINGHTFECPVGEEQKRLGRTKYPAVHPPYSKDIPFWQKQIEEIEELVDL